MDDALLGLSLVVILSVLARLSATWMRVPPIVPLLVIGVAVGISGLGLIDPVALLGPALSPAVEIAVGIILFEGALGLKREELASGVRGAVTRLITIGVVITWFVATVSIAILLDVPHPIAILIGATVIVSGPTVVLPILDFIGPTQKVRRVLKWEGILIDPIGAIIAVVVFGSFDNGTGGRFDIGELFLSLGVGGLVGVAGAALMMPVLGTKRLAGRDKVAATLMMVVASFAVSDAILSDSGLVATIVMGVALANQHKVRIEQVAEFKETLVPILVGILFVLLAANVDVNQVIDLGWKGLLVIAALIFIARPLAALTLVGLPFTWQEKLFFGSMAPRGIVAASTASAFGLALTDRDVPGAQYIIPVTFMIIVGTVFYYSLVTPWLARVLGLSGEHRPTLLLIGAPPWALTVGQGLVQAGAEVKVWTESVDEAKAAAEHGLVTFGGPLDPENNEADSPLEDVAAFAVVSDDDSLNQLLSFQLAELYEANQVYRRRSPSDRSPIVDSEALELFHDGDVETEVQRRLAAGDPVSVVGPLAAVPEGAVPLAAVIPRAGTMPAKIHLSTEEKPVRPDGRSTLLVLDRAPGPEPDPI
ncbi:MAG: sodium:proton antiporter [Solirubrobacterales bacterium]|nr:sodium:proton antiporter [Solirubrobacterales bacterium]MCB8914724.1 sodium:proton antiporter [Thermoleophilales bacterium]